MQFSMQGRELLSFKLPMVMEQHNFKHAIKKESFIEPVKEYGAVSIGLYQYQGVIQLIHCMAEFSRGIFLSFFLGISHFALYS